jgi:hypothetical protein
MSKILTPTTEALRVPPGAKPFNGSPTKAQKAANTRYVARATGGAMYIVELARKYTARSIQTLGDTLIDETAPIAVRIKCAEILLDRAYGKAPQAVLVGDATSDQHKLGIHALPILERIKMLKEAKDGPVTTDLEASELTEVSSTPVPAETESAPIPVTVSETPVQPTQPTKEDVI